MVGSRGQGDPKARVTEKAVLLQQPSRIRQHPPEGTATDQVQVDVVDLLPGVGSTVQDEPVSLLVEAAGLAGLAVQVWTRGSGRTPKSELGRPLEVRCNSGEGGRSQARHGKKIARLGERPTVLPHSNDSRSYFPAHSG